MSSTYLPTYNLVASGASNREKITLEIPIFSRARKVPYPTPMSITSTHGFHPRSGLIPALLTKIETLPSKTFSA